MFFYGGHTAGGTVIVFIVLALVLNVLRTRNRGGRGPYRRGPGPRGGGGGYPPGRGPAGGSTWSGGESPRDPPIHWDIRKPDAADPNTGDANAGDANAGDANAGDASTGNPNAGYPSAGNPNAGSTGTSEEHNPPSDL
jgi:hypothetical protein